LEFQKKFSDLINRKFFYPSIEETISGEYKMIKSKSTKWCIQVHNFSFKLDTFNRLKEMILCVLHSENIIKESLEIEDSFSNVFEIDNITYEERQKKIAEENYVKALRIEKEEKEKKEMMNFLNQKLLIVDLESLKNLDVNDEDLKEIENARKIALEKNSKRI